MLGYKIKLYICDIVSNGIGQTSKVGELPPLAPALMVIGLL